jgi:hypothetical protein
MKEIFVSKDATRVGHMKSVLDAAGIVSFIRNEHGFSGALGMAGLVRSQLVDPVLCVMDDERYDEAVSLLKPLLEAPTMTATDWTCAACHEEVPGSFELCWKCQAERS